MAESEVFELITSTNEFVERYSTRNNKPKGTSSQHKSGINTRSKLRRKTTALKNCSDSSSEDDSSESNSKRRTSNGNHHHHNSDSEDSMNSSDRSEDEDEEEDKSGHSGSSSNESESDQEKTDEPVYKSLSKRRKSLNGSPVKFNEIDKNKKNAGSDSDGSKKKRKSTEKELTKTNKPYVKRLKPKFKTIPEEDHLNGIPKSVLITQFEPRKKEIEFALQKLIEKEEDNIIDEIKDEDCYDFNNETETLIKQFFAKHEVPYDGMIFTEQSCVTIVKSNETEESIVVKEEIISVTPKIEREDTNNNHTNNIVHTISIETEKEKVSTLAVPVIENKAESLLPPRSPVKISDIRVTSNSSPIMGMTSNDTNKSTSQPTLLYSSHSPLLGIHQPVHSASEAILIHHEKIANDEHKNKRRKSSDKENLKEKNGDINKLTEKISEKIPEKITEKIPEKVQEKVTEKSLPQNKTETTTTTTTTNTTLKNEQTIIPTISQVTLSMSNGSLDELKLFADCILELGETVNVQRNHGNPPKVPTQQPQENKSIAKPAVVVEETFYLKAKNSKMNFFPLGEIVWTRGTPGGQPFWPAMTIGFSQVPSKIVKLNTRTEITQLVRLFGHKEEYAWFEPTDLSAFRGECYDIYINQVVKNKSLNRLFNKSITDAEKAEKQKIKSDVTNIKSWLQELQDFEAGKTEELYQGYFFSNYQAAAAKKQILEPRNSRRTEKKVTKTTTPVRAETTSRSRRKVQVQNKEDDGDWGQENTPVKRDVVSVEDSDEDYNVPAKPTKTSRVKINRPRLGEIPEVEDKKVSCGHKSGRVVSDKIRCDCCRKFYGPAQFEAHAGRAAARNPYKTIIVTESGKALDEYRYCTYCHTRETSWWSEGPYGERTLCESCGKKYKQGVISQVFFKPLIVASQTAECRAKSVIKAKRTKQHLPTCEPCKSIEFSEFTYDVFVDYIINKRQPLVLKNATKGFNNNLWNFDFLRRNYGNTDIQIRYMEMEKDDESQFGVIKDATKSLKWFLDNAENPNYDNDPDFDYSCVGDGRQAVMYAKDFSFGEMVPEWLNDLIPKLPGHLTPHSSYDLMGSPPPSVRPIVWMAYVGANGSRTPLHVDKLATVAFNMHVCGDGEKQWWLVDHKEIEKLEKIIENNGGNLYKDTYWMAPDELEKTGLKMWHVTQKKGDMVIVPPMVPHTVINEGPLSCAVAANMMPADVVDSCWKAEQINRSINRPSIYRLKNSVYYAVKKSITTKDSESLKKLINVFKEIITEEEAAKEEALFLPIDEYFLCDRCSCDIFNRRYHCEDCRIGDYDLCVQCYNEIGADHYHKMKLYEKIPLISLREMLKDAWGLVRPPGSNINSPPISPSNLNLVPDQRMRVEALLLN